MRNGLSLSNDRHIGAAIIHFLHILQTYFIVERLNCSQVADVANILSTGLIAVVGAVIFFGNPVNEELQSNKKLQNMPEISNGISQRC